MKRNISKILIILTVIVLSLGILCACDKDEDEFDNKYNAKLYYSMIDHLDETYLSEHSTYGTDTYFEGDTRPHKYIELITDAEGFNNAFKTFPYEIDFETQMLVLYFYTGTAIKSLIDNKPLYEYKIKDLIYLDNDLQISIAKKSLAKDAAPRALPPEQECLVIKIDKLMVNTINISIMYE